MYGSRPRYVERDTLETYSIDNTREYFFKPYIRVGGDRMDNKNLSRHIRKERLNGSLLFCTIAKQSYRADNVQIHQSWLTMLVMCTVLSGNN